MYCLFFFFKDPATTELYTYGHPLSLHDALPISPVTPPTALHRVVLPRTGAAKTRAIVRSGSRLVRDWQQTSRQHVATGRQRPACRNARSLGGDRKSTRLNSSH